MTREHVLAPAMALGFAVVLAYGLIWAAEPAEPAPVADLPKSDYDDRILMLEEVAIEEAFKQQIIHIFSVWMKDDTGQPARAVTGAKQAERAFIGSMEALERRRHR